MADHGAVSMLVAALAAVAAAATLQFFYKMYRTRTRLASLPGPPHSFLWGHLKVMGEIAATFPPNMHPQSYITAISQKYELKGIFYLDLWPVADPQVILIEPDLMDQVQVKRAYNQHPMSEEMLGNIVGPNVVATANGPVWKKLHHAMAPSFLQSHVRTLTGLMADETMQFRSRLTSLADSGGAFSFEKECSKLIFDIVAQIVFNFSLHAQTQGSSYLDDLKETIELFTQSLGLNPLVKLKVRWKKGAITKRLDAAIRTQIEDRWATLRQEKMVPTRKNFLSILDLMLRETLSRDGLGDTKSTKLPKEELDLLVTNSTVTYQNQVYPIGDLVITPCWHTMHYDEAFFPSPSSFRPERFLGDDAVPRGWFRSFSRGARACLGQDLAMDMMRVVLLLTARDYDFACAGVLPNDKPKSKYTNLDTVFGDIVFAELGMEARPRGGMMMTVKESGYCQ
ncbi:hypothetical protein LQW54_010518 [Pestalotiopsis sp. IQ-011]